MSLESIICLILGIPIGIASGLWSGVVVARYARFAELRNESLRIIRKIDFMQEDGKIQFHHTEDISKFNLISSDLYFLKHREAGDIVSALIQKITSLNYDASVGKVGMTQYSTAYVEWQNTIRLLSPKYSVILSLWGKL